MPTRSDLQGVAALWAGRFREAVAGLRSASSRTRPGSLADATVKRMLAEALLAAGEYPEGVTTAGLALDVALADDRIAPRRRLEAWTTLALAENLAEITTDRSRHPFEEAELLAEDSGLHGCLSVARLKRLRAGALSAAGDQAGARDALAAIATVEASPTRRGKRESLHVSALTAIIQLRSSDPAGAAAALDDITRQRASLLGAWHPETLTALHNRAAALRRTTDRRDAAPIWEEVARARVEVLGSDHPDTLVTRSLHAVQQAEGGAAAIVTDEIQSILRAARQRLGDSHSVVLQIAGRVASILDKAGRPADALAVMAEWAARAREALGPGHPEAGSLLHEYGNVLHQAGQLAQAYDVFGELAEATRLARGDDHIETVASYNSLAVIASDLGDNAPAEALYRAMLATLDRLGPAHALDQASVRNNLAHLLLVAGRVEEARPLFETVLRTREERLEPRHRLLHLSRGNLAATLARSGRHEEALDLHRRVLAERTEAFGPRHPDRLASLHNVAATLHDIGRDLEAIPLLDEVCAIRREILGEAHANTIASKRALADSLEAVGRISEAEVVLRAIRDTVEDLRRDGELPDDMRRGLFAQYVPAYRSLAMIAAARGDADEFFAIAEAVKARTLIERMVARSGLREGLLSAESLARWRSVERQIAALENRIPSAIDPTLRNALVVERDDLLDQWRGLQEELQDTSEGCRKASTVRALTLEAGRALLAADEVFLSYVVHGDRVAAVWLGGSGQVGCSELGRFPSLSKTAVACRALLAQPNGMVGLLTEDAGQPSTVWRLPDGGFEFGAVNAAPPGAQPLLRDDEALEALSVVLLGRLPPEALAGNRLLVSTDGPLAMLPFEALRLGDANLLERCEVTYLPSLSFVANIAGRSRPRASNAIRLIAIGDPAFSPSDDGAGFGSSPFAAAATRSSRRATRWAQLPGSALELAAVASAYSLREGATLFTGASASLSTVRELASTGTLERADALLFSTHGYLDPVDPRRNALVLSSEYPGEAGLLTAAEVASLELTADLVVLSACDTGTGAYVAGEGVLGLPFAMVIAGCRTVVQTLWPVFDDATAAFVSTFLALYRTGVAAPTALARTKRKMASGKLGPDFVAPANWAPFLIYGRSMTESL